MPGRINLYEQRHDPHCEINVLKEQLKKWILMPITIAIVPIDIARDGSKPRPRLALPTETTSRRQQPTPQKTDLHTILDT